MVDRTTKTRLLPVFYSDNYVSVLPGESVTLSLDCPPGLDEENAVVSVRGWNVTERFAEIQRSAAPAPDN